ncbi:MAG: hypothetical protein ACOYWZ_18395 [Bacillota bacterium]
MYVSYGVTSFSLDVLNSEYIGFNDVGYSGEESPVDGARHTRFIEALKEHLGIDSEVKFYDISEYTFWFDLS